MLATKSLVATKAWCVLAQANYSIIKEYHHNLFDDLPI